MASGSGELPDDGDPVNTPAPAAPLVDLTAHAMHQLYGRMRIDERFPDEGGSLRLDRIFACYQIGPLTDTAWFMPDGSRSIIDHGINSRRHAVVDNVYAQSILTRGVVDGVRGEPWMIFSEGQQLPLQAITWASLSRSFYHAAQMEPDNKFIKNALKAGLRRCRRLHENTPDDVIAWLRDYHNQFHGGARFSFTELLTEIPEIEEGWVAYRTQHGITARLGAGTAGGDSKTAVTYEKVYWQWVKANHDGKVSSWKQYDSAKSLVHGLKKMKIWDSFLELCQSRVNFLQNGLNHETVLILILSDRVLSGERALENAVRTSERGRCVFVREN